MPAITVVTGNPGKVAEFRELLGFEVIRREAALVEIQAIDVATVARAKAAEAYAVVGAPVIVDDTGFALAAWNGLPGALVTWFLQSVGPQGLIEMADGLEDRRVQVTTAIGYADEHGVQVFEGSLSGGLAEAPRGDNGFGYDAVFVPDGHDRTFAEMSSAEKNEMSMRRLAVDALKQGLGL